MSKDRCTFKRTGNVSDVVIAHFGGWGRAYLSNICVRMQNWKFAAIFLCAQGVVSVHKRIMVLHNVIDTRRKAAHTLA
jgi:hypothetical protein